jgi:hypothetical protein
MDSATILISGKGGPAARVEINLQVATTEDF